MNTRDQALLDKQLRWLNPARRRGGARLLATAAVLLAGITFGGSMFAYASHPRPIASPESIVETW